MIYPNIVRQLWPDEVEPDMRPLRVAVSIVRKQLGDAPARPRSRPSRRWVPARRPERLNAPFIDQLGPRNTVETE